jgi:hypothetical protein
MGRTLKRVIYIMFTLFVLYSVAWYSWGIYIKKVMQDTFSSSKNYLITADKIELSGFPFNLDYSFRNLSVTGQTEDNNTVVNLGDIVFKSNLYIDTFTINTTKEITINTVDNKHNYTLRYDKPASLLIRLRQPAYRFLGASGDALAALFNFRNVKSLQYQDLGYSLEDNILKKIVFLSPKNNIDLTLQRSKEVDEFAVLSTLSGEGSIDSPAYMTGLFNLDSNFNIKLLLNEQDNQTKGIVFDFNKFNFTMQNYSLNILGNLTLMNSTQDSKGLITVTLNNVPNFLNSVEQISTAKKANYIRGLLSKMAGTNSDQLGDNLTVEIKNEDRNIKFGHATIVDLMLYSLHN